jgi:hypothetical protein
MMAGYRDICAVHLADPPAELLQLWHEEGFACVGVTLGTAPDTGVVSIEGQVSGFAAGVYWLPNGRGTVGFMCNGDLGGAKLRQLIIGRIRENLLGLHEADIFER